MAALLEHCFTTKVSNEHWMAGRINLFWYLCLQPRHLAWSQLAVYCVPKGPYPYHTQLLGMLLLSTLCSCGRPVVMLLLA